MKKLPLLLVILIGVLTPLLSTAFYFWWQPRQHTNIGELLPPTPLATAQWSAAARETAAGWGGYWVLVSVGGGECDDACRQRLCKMRALHLALPGAYQRLRRVWWVTDAQTPAAEILQPNNCGEGGEAIAQRARLVNVLDGVETVRVPARSLPAGVGGGGGGRDGAAAIYLLNPDGVWVSRFESGLTVHQIRRDVSRLLRLSKGRKFFTSDR